MEENGVFEPQVLERVSLAIQAAQPAILSAFGVQVIPLTVMCLFSRPLLAARLDYKNMI